MSYLVRAVRIDRNHDVVNVLPSKDEALLMWQEFVAELGDGFDQVDVYKIIWYRNEIEVLASAQSRIKETAYE